MQVLINMDGQFPGGEESRARVEEAVAARLDRFGERITRIEVHLGDLGHKPGDRDKRCLMEARVGGMKPIAVSHEAATLTEAVHGAADRLERALEHSLGRLQETKGRAPPEDQVASVEALQELERTEADARGQR